VVEPGLRPLGVLLHLRRVRDPQLPGHEVQHRARHVERVFQERPEPPHGHQLEREPGLHVLPAAQVDQRPVSIIEFSDRSTIEMRSELRFYVADISATLASCSA